VPKLCDEKSDMNGGMVHLSEGNTTLMLLPGIHLLTNFTPVQSVTDVSIMGQGSDGSVVITCNPTVGLAFINVTNLSIQNVTIHRCAGLMEDNLLEVSQTVQLYVQLLWVGEGEVHSDPPYRVALIMLTTLGIVVLATTLRQLTHWARWPTNATEFGRSGRQLFMGCCLEHQSFS